MADIEQMMRTLKLVGLAKDWREAEYHDTEQYVTDLLQIELHEREVNELEKGRAYRDRRAWLCSAAQGCGTAYVSGDLRVL